MKSISLEPFQWIKEERESYTEDPSLWKGNFVSHCIPDRFEAYCKILHPFRRDLSITDESLTYEQSPEIEEYLLGEALTSRELAKKYHLDYTKEISTDTFIRACGGSLPRYLVGCDHGSMDMETMIQIVKTLTSFKKENQLCYFHYYFAKTKDITLGRDQLFLGKLEDVILLFDKDGLWGSPTYWWPEDKSWCLCTSYHLDFTLFGGNREMAEGLLSNQELECIEVSAETRIDYLADENNLPKP
ncbi:MAG TPA: hypothetical protein VIG80_13595 [Bacillaceae bacterium]